MLNEDIVKEAIEDMEHCIEIGNITFQIPQEEHIIAAIMASLKKQVSKKPSNCFEYGICLEGLCPSCNSLSNDTRTYCSECGQKLGWD